MDSFYKALKLSLAFDKMAERQQTLQKLKLLFFRLILWAGC